MIYVPKVIRMALDCPIINLNETKKTLLKILQDNLEPEDTTCLYSRQYELELGRPSYLIRQISNFKSEEIEINKAVQDLFELVEEEDYDFEKYVVVVAYLYKEKHLFRTQKVLDIADTKSNCKFLFYNLGSSDCPFNSLSAHPNAEVFNVRLHELADHIAQQVFQKQNSESQQSIVLDVESLKKELEEIEGEDYGKTDFQAG